MPSEELEEELNRAERDGNQFAMLLQEESDSVVTPDPDEE